MRKRGERLEWNDVNAFYAGGCGGSDPATYRRMVPGSLNYQNSIEFHPRKCYNDNVGYPRDSVNLSLNTWEPLNKLVEGTQ